MHTKIWNLKWLYFQIAFCILILFGVFLWDPDAWWYSAIPIALGVFLVMGWGVAFPYRYGFDPDCLTLYYCFGLCTHIRWVEIKTIEIRYHRTFPWLIEYEIGYFETKLPFREIGTINKNRKTEALMRKYLKTYPNIGKGMPKKKFKWKRKR